MKTLDTAESITFRTFAFWCEWQEVAKNLGYSRDLPMGKDWSVSYSKSTYGGLRCYILHHSECDFIFLRPEDAKMLQDALASEISTAQWKRATSYGKAEAVDPR